MSILSSTGKIYLILVPVNGRWGMIKLMQYLEGFKQKDSIIEWDGKEEITIVTLNKKRTLCSVLHVDENGVDRLVPHNNLIFTSAQDKAF